MTNETVIDLDRLDGLRSIELVSISILLTTT